MERLSLYEEFRLVERSETEVNGAWKGAHLLLFFMAFVFGSFCTFCFHMLMYLFEEKCVLFPKLISLTSLRHNVISEFLPVDKEAADMLPLDFMGMQWMDKSVCYLPTYVPLISGIFGLVWTTMFLMCSTGSRALTGLHRPWRVLPPVFMFSLAMGFLCIYSSAVTHTGLDELCSKLGEITGSSTCTYTVNVATLAYERRIRGVYQAIRLTILSAWLHTFCWLLSALLTLSRVILAVDFQLVRVNVDLIGNIDKLMERHEQQIRTVSPDVWFNNERSSTSLVMHPKYHNFTGNHTKGASHPEQDVEMLYRDNSNALLYVAPTNQHSSSISLLLEESDRLARKRAYKNNLKQHKFIVNIVYNLLKKIPISEITPYVSRSSSIIERHKDSSASLVEGRNKNQEETKNSPFEVTSQLQFRDKQEEVASTSRDVKTFSARQRYNNKPKRSAHNLTDNLQLIPTELNPNLDLNKDKTTRIVSLKKSSRSFRPKKGKKSNLKTTDSKKRTKSRKVELSGVDETDDIATNTFQEVDKETQTNKKKEKEKQD